MSRANTLRSISKHKWRHSTYVAQLHNVYIRDSKVVLARETEGASEPQAFRRKLEFYSRLCGKVIQHLDKQSKSPTTQHQESARWTYSGIFLTILHNLNDIHQKDLVVLLVALTKLLRGDQRGKVKADALRSTVESFMVSLLICSDRMIGCVQNIAHGIEPTMNKWKSFANLMQAIEERYQASIQHEENQCLSAPPTGESTRDSASEETTAVDANEDSINPISPQTSNVISSEELSACLARDANETLFAAIIQRSTMQKDFARLAFVLHWLDHVGFPHEMINCFFSMMLQRMIDTEPANRKDLYARDIISILKYALSFEIDVHFTDKLYGYLSECNGESMLQLNLQDSSSLLDCILHTDVIDQGILVAVFANLQLWIKAENMPNLNTATNILHSYLSEKNRISLDEPSKWSDVFIGFAQLKDLADTFIRKDALNDFMQKTGCAPYNGKTVFSSKHMDETRIWNDIIVKLQKLCITLEETRPYCVALIEHLSQSKTTDGP